MAFYILISNKLLGITLQGTAMSIFSHGNP